MLFRKLPMQTLPILHLLNRLYIEQVTCHLLMLLLSARACSETVKRNSVCLEIPFSQEFVSYGKQSIDWRCKLVDWFLCDASSAVISPDIWVGSFSLGARALQIFGQVAGQSAETVPFWRGFSCRVVGWGFCNLCGVISKQIIVLPLIVIFKLTLSRRNLLKVDID